MAKYWFKRRRYGYGWLPSAWQGWTVVGIYLAVVLGGALTLKDVPKNEFSSEHSVFLMVALLATISLLQIFYRKGQKT